jgi:hypothetical protein
MFSVTTQTEDRTLLTLAELRAAIGVASGQDSQLASLNARVASVITQACRVASAGALPPTLRLETVSDTYRLKSRQNVLILSRRPVVQIASVVEAGVTLESAAYEVDPSAGLLYRLSGDDRVCWGCGKTVVAYAAGWETVPQELKEAACKLARVLWSEADNGGTGLKRESIPGVIDREWWVGPSDDPLIPAEIADLLAPYVNHWVG